jgi:hypothetical protein
LREALAEVEAGRVETVLVILKHPDGSWTDKRSLCMNFPEAIGRLTISIQAWINGYIRESHDG